MVDLLSGFTGKAFFNAAGMAINAGYFAGLAGFDGNQIDASFAVGQFDDFSGETFTLSFDAESERLGLTATTTLDLGVASLNADIELSFANGSLLLEAGGARFNATHITGSAVVSEAGIAGLLRVGELALTDANDQALLGIDLSAVRNVNIGFNTTGAAVAADIGGLAFDFSADEFHDFLAVDADLDLKLSMGPVDYTLSGRFAFATPRSPLMAPPKMASCSRSSMPVPPWVWRAPSSL